MPSKVPPRRILSTIPDMRAPVLVVVAPNPELLDACHEASRFLAVRLEVTEVNSVATSAARLRPFAIILEEDVFAFDPNEFTALARDVGAEVITVSASMVRDELLGVLLPRLKTALAEWNRDSTESG